MQILLFYKSVVQVDILVKDTNLENSTILVWDRHCLV